MVIIGKSLIIVKFHIDKIVTILLFILSTGGVLIRIPGQVDQIAVHEIKMVISLVDFVDDLPILLCNR